MFNSRYLEHFEVEEVSDHNIRIKFKKSDTRYVFVQDPGLAAWIIRKVGSGGIPQSLSGAFKSLDLAGKAMHIYCCINQEAKDKELARKEKRNAGT